MSPSITATHRSTHPTTRSKKVAYWAVTGLVGFAYTAIGTADLVHAPPLMAGLKHLGYPDYLATILGAWKVLGAVTVLVPGLPRVKEWAYAGMFFNLTGAALSHASVGDPAGNVIAPLVLLAFVVASWVLVPARYGKVGNARQADAKMPGLPA